MNTLAFSQNLVLRPQYQMSPHKLVYLENKMKNAINPRIVTPVKLVKPVEPEPEYELVFGDTEFNNILSNKYNTYDKPAFDTEEEWDIIMMENLQTDEDFYGFESDSDYDFSDDEIEC